MNTSLLANGLWSNGCQVQAALCDLELLPRGERGERNPLVEFYETADSRQISLALVNADREWPLLVQALGKPEWLEEPLFATPLARFENAVLLSTWLGDVFASQPWDYWDAVLGPSGVTYGLVGRIGDHPYDPQLEANGLLRDFVDGDGLRTLDSPFQVVGEEKHPPRMAPDVGRDTRRILHELGLGEREIEQISGANHP